MVNPHCTHTSHHPALAREEAHGAPVTNPVKAVSRPFSTHWLRHAARRSHLASYSEIEKELLARREAARFGATSGAYPPAGGNLKPGHAVQRSNRRPQRLVFSSWRGDRNRFLAAPA